MQPWALRGGPDEDTLRRLIETEEHSDSEIAELYGVRRQTATYWRMKIGITTPGAGHGPRKRRRERLSHKDLIWWEVRQAHMNHPIRKRLVEVSMKRQGAQMAPDAESRDSSLRRRVSIPMGHRRSPSPLARD